MQPLALSPLVLTGPTLELRPVSLELLPAIAERALEAPEIWRHIPYPVRTPEDVKRVLERALALAAHGQGIGFVTQRRPSGDIVGGTSLVLVDAHVPCVEIGGTWIVPRWQRTHVNTEAKGILLAHCFETLGCERVEFKTDALNERSRAALRRLGAREEGTHRCHMRRADGTLRDSVYFSIVASEWPTVRSRYYASWPRRPA